MRSAQIQMDYALVATALLFVIGITLFWLGYRRREATGLPVGDVIYSDTGVWQAVAEPLVSRRYGLVGRPDYLVTLAGRGGSSIVPVEVKSARSPSRPHASHVLQLAAYCLLVEDVFGERPSFGLLRYANATLHIPFTAQLRQQVLDTAAEIRAGRTATALPRSHTDAGRCRACSYRQACGSEALG
jgi:CRISPR-associated exonuclease Cas4